MLWDGAITLYSDNFIDYFYFVGLAIVHLNRQKIIEN